MHPTTIIGMLAYVGVSACYAHSAAHSPEHLAVDVVLAVLYSALAVVHLLDGGGHHRGDPPGGPGHHDDPFDDPGHRAG